MSQCTLTVATRGNHAALLPVVLIATSINEARPTPVIDINYEDSAVLDEGEKAVVQLTTGSNSVFGTVNAIEELRTQFPYLASKDLNLVSYPAIIWVTRV
jgi:glutamyl-tRNA synthetase